MGSHHNAIREEDTQHAMRLMDAKDLKSALAYSMKYEAAKTVSKTSRNVRSIETEDDTSRESDDEYESLFNILKKIIKQSCCWEEQSSTKSEYDLLEVEYRRFRYAITDFPSQVSQKGVLVAAPLADLKREAIPVRFLNLDNKLKTLDKGAIIATCEPVVDIVARPQEFSEAQHLPSILENLEGLDEKQCTEVRELLQEFQNLFSTSDSDVGRCNMTQHRINTGNHPPIKQ
ncbi:hypothetical protein AVEN_112379-1 [Araneus ventricosus]|uniref:Uncharacterized protein n=1 Tax=Araneus ventricosus TaxID=182803 RepID=A0A4Y2M4C9_ARAVE|nr:hypothetical protein AVEN_112379-1 [Araneus ventricosus]